MSRKARTGLIGTLLLVTLLMATSANTHVIGSPPSYFAVPLRPNAAGPPSGYEGELDYLRPLIPIWQPPLADPVGLGLNSTGTQLYVIEKDLHRLSAVDVDPASGTYTAITPVTDALEDPQMAVTLNTTGTHAFVVENAPGTLKRVTLDTGQVTTVTADLHYPCDVVLSDDGTTAYVTQYEGALVSVNLSSGSVTTLTTGLENPTGIALDADGTGAYVAEMRKGPLRQVNLTTGAITDFSTGEIDRAYDIAVDETNGWAYLTEHNMRLARVNLNTGAVDALIESTSERIEAIALSPDGNTLYGAQWGTGRLLAIDVATTTPESVFPMLQRPAGLDLNEDGTCLYILEELSGDLTVQDIDPDSAAFGALDEVAAAASPGGQAVAVNGDETWALVAHENDLRRVDLASGTVSTVITGAFNHVMAIALNAAGTVGYVGDYSGIWQVDTSTWAISQLASLTTGAHALALSPDEATLYAVGFDNNDYETARLVEVRISDGRVAEIDAGVGMPVGLALTPDGEQAIVADDAAGGRLHSVNLESGEATLLIHLSTWTLMDWNDISDVVVGPDGTAYVAATNWLNDPFFTQAGMIYGFLPGSPWRLDVPVVSSLHYPEDQAISSDGDWLYALAGNSLYQVQLANGADHGQITPLVDGLIKDPRGIALTSDDATWVVAGCALHKISLADGSLLDVIQYCDDTSGSAEYGLGLSADETLGYLATKGGELAQIDLSTGNVSVIATGLASPRDPVVNAAGNTVYLAEQDADKLIAVTVPTGTKTTVSAGLESPVSVALDEANDAVIVLEAPYPCYYISSMNITSGAVTRLFDGERNARENVTGLALTPDHARAYFLRQSSGEVWGVDLNSGQIVDSPVEGLNGPTGLALTGGGAGAYTTEEFVPRIRHANLNTGAISTTVHLPGPAHGLALTQDETTAYVTRMYHDDLLEVDLASGTWVTVTEGCMHGRIVLDPTETTAYVSCPGGDKINTVNLSTGARTELVTGMSAYALDLNQAGTRLYVSAGAVGEIGDFQLWAVDVPTGTSTLVATIAEAQDAPGDITLSPDEEYVYVYDQLGSRVGAGLWRVDVNPASPTYGQVTSQARWLGELQHGEFMADDQHFVLTDAFAHRLLNLCLGDDCIPLQADFFASPPQGSVNLLVSFTNTSRGDYTASQWDFGNGVTSTLENPTHTYTTAGVYTVALTVTQATERDTVSDTITVYGAPQAGFTSSSPDRLGQASTFTNTTTGQGVITYDWDFGDGVTSTLESPTHTYATARTYTVVLTAANTAGNDVTSDTVTIYSPPQAGFTSSSPDWLGQTTIFTNTTTGQEPITYLWDFGDEITSVEESPTHTYTATGTYTVVLTATNAMGSDVVSDTVTVNGPSDHSVILANDFEDGAGDWYLSGDWTVQASDGNHVLHGVGADLSFARSDTTWDNYRFEVHVRVQSGEAKLAIRTGDFDAGYYLGLEADGALSLAKWDGVGWTDLRSDPGPYSAGQWHILALEGEGDQLRAYVDGALKIEASDADYPSGGLLLNVSFGEADFDNVWMVGDAPQTCAIIPSNGLNNPNGIAFNPQGDLFVTDGGKLSRVTDEQRAVFVAQVGAPGDLVIDEDDNAYVTMPDQRSIVKITPDGTKTTLITFDDTPWNLAIGPSGYLYVTVLSDIMRVDLNDASSSLWMTGVAGAMAFDQAGNLYTQEHETVLKITSDKVVSTVIMLPTIAPYKQYTGLAVDEAGNLYVGEALGVQWSPTDPPWLPPIVADKVFRITPEGNVSTFATGLGGVWGLTFGSDGYLYVAEHDYSGVSKIAPDGTVTPVVPCNGLASVDSATYSPDGRLYFVNTEAFNVSWLDSQGDMHVVGTGFNVAGCGGGRPELEFTDTDEFYITEPHFCGPNRITKITGDSATVFSHDVDCPNGLALDQATGDIYVSEGLLNNVVRFSPDGTRHDFVSGLSHPLQLAFGPDGLLYVAECDADRVSQIDAHGVVTPFASVPNPFGLAFRGEDLFVGSDAETGEIWRVDETGSAFLFAYGPSHVGGITVAPDGAIVGAFSGPNSIYRFAEETAAPALALTSLDLLRAEPGTTVTHTFKLGNMGNGRDGAWLTATSEHGWTVTVPGGGFFAPLTCGDESRVDIAVTVPASIPLGIQDILTLTATSRLDPTVIESVQSVTVYGLPEASFASSSPDWLGQTSVFTNTTTGPEPITYEWDFGDEVTNTLKSPTHTYTAPGTHTVVMTATNVAGSDMASNTITVYGPPTVDFVASAIEGFYPFTVTFTSTVTTMPHGDPTLTYLWRFGDGGTSTQTNPSHTYATSGAYTVSLTVSNAAGSDTLSREGYVTVDGTFEVFLPVILCNK